MLSTVMLKLRRTGIEDVEDIVYFFTKGKEDQEKDESETDIHGDSHAPCRFCERVTQSMNDGRTYRVVEPVFEVSHRVNLSNKQ